jgi:aarF domain-containing kinase
MLPLRSIGNFSSRATRLKSSLMVRCVKNSGFKYALFSAAVILPTASDLYNARHNHSRYTTCELTHHLPSDQTLVSAVKKKTVKESSNLKEKVMRILRMFARAVKLSVALAPLVFLFPLLRSKSPQDDAHQVALKGENEVQLSWFSKKYLNFCVRNVEWSGAAVIKLMQWLSSRPDLVGHEFCSIFSKLQANTTPHEWKYTEEALKEAYGEDWHERIHIDKIVGSGCIGQVYKGSVNMKTSGKDNKNEKTVAIKVLHPSIIQDLEADLDLLRLMAKILPKIFEPLSWLNPKGAVEEFGRMLLSQLDLRHEARNLQRFNKEFEDDFDKIIFPVVVSEFPPSRNVLVETFIEGQPILEFAKENSEKSSVLRQLCINGIMTVCKMIFLLNHCHGDLHPGNVLVTKDYKLALLDAGIVNEYKDSDHQLIVNVLTSFIRYDGRSAGRLLIDNSNLREGHALEEELFMEKMEELSIKARSGNYLMEHLGSYISQICEAAATHHVLMNQAFVSAALAIKVQEGIVLCKEKYLQILFIF